MSGTHQMNVDIRVYLQSLPVFSCLKSQQSGSKAKCSDNFGLNLKIATINLMCALPCWILIFPHTTCSLVYMSKFMGAILEPGG